jgi:hypothetical protein
MRAQAKDQMTVATGQWFREMPIVIAEEEPSAAI